MKRFVFVILFVAYSFSLAFSQTEWTPAKNNSLVNDYVGVLSPEHRAEIESRLRRFNDSTSTQIVVVIVENLYGDDIMNMAQRIGNTWGVGQEDFSNGMVLLIKARSEYENFGEVAIATGYGLESAFPDIFCSRIIQEYMVGYLQDGDFYRAISDALDIIEPVAAGEYSYAMYKKREQREIVAGVIVLALMVIALAIAAYIYNKRHPGSFSGGSGSSSGSGSDVWVTGHFPSGSRGSSGGFGGFGGGGFGGGGASGRF